MSGFNPIGYCEKCDKETKQKKLDNQDALCKKCFNKQGVSDDAFEQAKTTLWEFINAYGENPNSETAEDVSMQIIEVTNLAYLKGKNNE